MAAVSAHMQDIKIQDQSDDDPYSPNTRDTTSPECHDDEKSEDISIRSSSFSIHNVLKKERDNSSPDNVFSTDKLLENTPNFDDRNTESVSPVVEVNEREISVDDGNSCCSDDTVLSVGNEAPVSNYEEKASQNTHQELTSFKHIQTHLSAISQLSQNMNVAQPLLLRPSPINPNPIMFLNQPLLFQSPILSQDLKGMPNRQTANVISPTFGLNFGMRLKANHETRTRSDENRYSKPEESRDYINQNCLKFSIDNILKADFGRRITDPLHKRKVKTRYEAKPAPAKDTAAFAPKLDEARVPDIKTPDKAGAIDLSKDDSGSNSGSTSGKYQRDANGSRHNIYDALKTSTREWKIGVGDILSVSSHFGP